MQDSVRSSIPTDPAWSGALYPEALLPLSDATFANPPSAYRGAPFWSWNGKLEKQRLRDQLDAFREMGLGGGHIHSRTGLATPYLSEEFMQCVRDCVDHAAAHDMKIWLYDEDRWPSGAAGGIVTRDHSLRLRTLVFTPEPLPEEPEEENAESQARYTRGKTTLLARYAVRVEKDHLVCFRKLDAGEEPAKGEDPWYAYNCASGNSSWFNHEAYVDTLNPKAIERFRDVTHEAYAKTVGDAFGKSIHAIFTDEPQVVHQKMLGRSSDRSNVLLPWTDDLPESYAAAWNEDLLEQLPLLVFEPEDGSLPPVRWRFRDHVAERFAIAFADTLGNWCQKHGIALTGHMMEEPTLESQSHSIIEAMRHYRSFQLPGIDMLCDHFELTTAKQAQSAVHQDGRPGMLSELYGVTNWDFPFSGHKRQGDWQAALGVTVRVHHLTWVSMGGNAKRDYPASMGPHVPWYREYPYIENHFARLNAILTRGKPRVRVAVVHPIESYWLTRGPDGQCKAERDSQEKRFREITHWLLENLIDFDFISESRLPGQNPHVEDGRLQVGEMAYDAVIVPGLRTIRSSTCDVVESFLQSGDKVVWAGRIPDHVDALPDDRPRELAGRSACAQWDPTAIIGRLEAFREVEAISADGGRPDDCLYQLREEGEDRHLFICCTRESFVSSPEERLSRSVATRIRVKGKWSVMQHNTMSGERCPLPHRHLDGWTEFLFDRYHGASLCVTLSPSAESANTGLSIQAFPRETGRLRGPCRVTLEEPNVLALDSARWRLQGDPEWQPREDLLVVTNGVRSKLGWPHNHGGVAQPWCEKPDDRSSMVELAFDIDAQEPAKAPELVLERVDEAQLELNGKDISASPSGWWVDQDLRTVPLPDLPAGRNQLIIRIPVTPRNTLEWCYLLGDFGVTVHGPKAVLTQPVRSLEWGDATRQGLPFYGGNFTYHAKLEHAGGPCSIRLPYLKEPAVVVHLNGMRVGLIALDPHLLKLGDLPAGTHDLDLTVLGSRINTFGQLHNSKPDEHWWGPPSWETTGANRSTVYQLRPTGILTEPLIG